MFKNINKSFKKLFGIKSQKAEEVQEVSVPIVKKIETPYKNIGGYNYNKLSNYKLKLSRQTANRIRKRRRLEKIAKESRRINHIN